MVKIFKKKLKLKFGQYFAAVVWLRLLSWILVKILELGFVKILNLLGQASLLSARPRLDRQARIQLRV